MTVLLSKCYVARVYYTKITNIYKMQLFRKSFFSTFTLKIRFEYYNCITLYKLTSKLQFKMNGVRVKNASNNCEFIEKKSGKLRLSSLSPVEANQVLSSSPSENCNHLQLPPLKNEAQNISSFKNLSLPSNDCYDRLQITRDVYDEIPSPSDAEMYDTYGDIEVNEHQSSSNIHSKALEPNLIGKIKNNCFLTLQSITNDPPM